ncbi:MAG: hypothetical protein PSN46_10340, partial [Gammaproteobacteria bacterium]|nr:hypothetical protein [Gammaproteobacteria bacterium]
MDLLFLQQRVASPLFEEAIDWIDWCLSLDQANEATRRHNLCLKALLAIKWDDERD